MNIWKEINRSLNVDEKTTDHWWSVVVDKYSESQRHYHTMSHIEDMLRLYEEYKGKLRDVKPVVYTIIFHE